LLPRPARLADGPAQRQRGIDLDRASVRDDRLAPGRHDRQRAAAPARTLRRGDDVCGRRPGRPRPFPSLSLVPAFAEAFNRPDVDALLDCFTTDATYTDNFYGPHRGPVALREMFARMFKEGRDYRWQMDTIVETAERAAAEWAFGYVVTDAVPRSA